MSTHPEPPTRATRHARRVVLARYRPGSTGEDEHTVHLVPLPLSSAESGAADALCGRRLRSDEIETVTPGDGMWCTLCCLAHVTGSPPAPDTAKTVIAAEQERAAVAYREVGWPVTLRGDQVSLDLDRDVDAVALVIPAILASEVTGVLVRRRCPPAVLAHPALPAHRIILAGERYGVRLTWPTGVHRVTGTLLLPPTMTAHGPVQWVRPPQPHALKLCREIDVVAALRTALSDQPPSSPPTDN